MALPEPTPPSFRALGMYLFRRLVKPVSLERRGEVHVQLRESSHPDFDFFLMVVLSCVIATLGLLVDSPAVIIGAMLVAPLMSPIIGLGLASITGDARLFRDAGVALVQGALVAIIISILLTFFNRLLPFIPLQDLPTEILARTRPSPIDLTIALAGGMAAAYALAQPELSAALPGVAIATALMPPLCTIGICVALGRWDLAGGALLLFVTSAVTIGFAGTLTFFALGFSPRRGQNGLLPRGLVVSALLTLVLLVPLTFLSVRFFNQAAENRAINQITSQEVARYGAELSSLVPTQNGDTLQLEITIRTSTPLSYQDVNQLQRDIAFRLQKPVSVVVNQVFASRLDPLVPPTFTPTATPVTLTPTVTPTSTPTATSTPTNTPTPTATPSVARLANTDGRTLELVQTPGGPAIGKLRPGDVLTVLYKTQVTNGLVWQQVRDADGRLGWVPQIYLMAVTRTPTPVSTPTP